MVGMTILIDQGQILKWKWIPSQTTDKWRIAEVVGQGPGKKKPNPYSGASKVCRVAG